ncbi:hypothetical protein ACFXKK_26670 [Streptomyces globisporus]
MPATTGSAAGESGAVPASIASRTRAVQVAVNSTISCDAAASSSVRS